jgi:protein gp37
MSPFVTWKDDPSVRHVTGIQWTHAPGYIGATWNPLIGCAVRSPGCTPNCYAMKLAGNRLRHNPRYAGTTTMTKAGSTGIPNSWSALP